jgi:uncharacterized Zn-finger protein
MTSDDQEIGLAKLPDGKVVCLTCGKSYYDKSTCNRHIRTAHQSGIEVACTVCQKIYKNEPSLKAHMSKAHGITQRGNIQRMLMSASTNFNPHNLQFDDQNTADDDDVAPSLDIIKHITD